MQVLGTAVELFYYSNCVQLIKISVMLALDLSGCCLWMEIVLYHHQQELHVAFGCNLTPTVDNEVTYRVLRR